MTNSKPPEVLVLEDDPLASSALRLLLMQDGYTPIMADSVRQAMKLFTGQPYAILDLLLPDGSGMEVLHEIREKHPATKVLISSGTCNAETEMELDRMGVTLHHKPISILKIVQWMRDSAA